MLNFNISKVFYYLLLNGHGGQTSYSTAALKLIGSASAIPEQFFGIVYIPLKSL